jgi:hypothetical protein
MKQVKLSGCGKYAIIDDDDYDMCSMHRWVFDGGYATRMKQSNTGDRKWHKIRMHRLINSTPPGFVTDHINHNKLDNRKCNLRAVTQLENLQNKPMYKNNKSGQKNISMHKKTNKWRVQIRYNNTIIYHGLFDKLDDAITARNKFKQEEK